MKVITSIIFSIIISISYSQEKLISFEKVDSFSKSQLKIEWKNTGLPQIVSPIKYGVDLYELYYQTSLPSGKEVIATGLYFVPKGKKNDISTLQYNHGTTTRNRTKYDYNGESMICKIFATDGYAVAWQDYIGLGKAEGFHPYQHAETEGQSGVDLLKAIREINLKINLKTNNQLFITGYSQGGHATMAVHKMIEEKYNTVFNVTATSPMSGAYDMSGVQSKVMEIEYTQPHYLPYLLYGYQELYNIVEGKFENIFASPFDSIIPLYFDKNHGVGEINKVLPIVPIDMIAPKFAKIYKEDPNFIFTIKLKENNLHDWVPKSPVQLCYCENDEEVLAENSIVAYNYMTSHGAKHITKRDVGNTFTHHSCASFTALYSKLYFDSFRNGYKNGTKGAFFKNIIIDIAKKIKK